MNKSECGIDIHRVSECGSAALSYSANLLLLYMVLFRTPKELTVYSRVLLANCIEDLVFTSTSFFIEVVSIRQETVQCG